MTLTFRATQVRWLDSELEADSSDFRIVVGHHPMHVSNANEERQLSPYTDLFHPLLVKVRKTPCRPRSWANSSLL
jgi:hypothetical protein